MRSNEKARARSRGKVAQLLSQPYSCHVESAAQRRVRSRSNFFDHCPSLVLPLPFLCFQFFPSTQDLLLVNLSLVRPLQRDKSAKGELLCFWTVETSHRSSAPARIHFQTPLAARHDDAQHLSPKRTYADAVLSRPALATRRYRLVFHVSRSFPVGSRAPIIDRRLVLLPTGLPLLQALHLRRQRTARPGP